MPQDYKSSGARIEKHYKIELEINSINTNNLLLQLIDSNLEIQIEKNNIRFEFNFEEFNEIKFEILLELLNTIVNQKCNKI